MSPQNSTSEIQLLEQEIMEKKRKLAELRKIQSEQLVDHYVFLTALGKSVSLLDLFGDKDELIVVHNMGRGCSYCTMWADGFNGIYHHLIQKAAFVVSSPDDPEVQEDFAAERGWTFPMISTKGTSFKKDFGFETSEGYHPGVSTFRKDADDNIYHVADAPFGPGDDFCSVWYFLDLLSTGQEGFKPAKKVNSRSLYQLTNNIALQVKNYSKAIDFYEKIIGMKVEETYDNETKLSFNGTHFYVENHPEGHVFFEFAVDDFNQAKEQLLAAGCVITKEYHTKSAMLADPYGMKFHLFEVKK